MQDKNVTHDGFRKNPINTAVFPVAGMGTRFLPVTKAGPKEMLPIIDKPLIQYAVEEAIAANIKKLVFVTSSSKRAIEDYFDSNFELETVLEKKRKYDILAVVRNIVPLDVKVIYVRQPYQRGLGDAVLCAQSVVGNEPFAVLLADDVMQLGYHACLKSMLEIYDQTKYSVLGVETIPKENVDKYGIVSLSKNPCLPNQIESIIEKPTIENAPSNLAVIGRYILTPAIFQMLEQTEVGVGGEIQLTDALAQLLSKESITICPLKGRRYDCGSPMGFLQAAIDFSIQKPEYQDQLYSFMQEKIEERDSVFIK